MHFPGFISTLTGGQGGNDEDGSHPLLDLPLDRWRKICYFHRNYMTCTDAQRVTISAKYAGEVKDAQSLRLPMDGSSSAPHFCYQRANRRSRR